MAMLEVAGRCLRSDWRAVDQGSQGRSSESASISGGRVWSLRCERGLGSAVRLSEHRVREEQGSKSAGQAESRRRSVQNRPPEKEAEEREELNDGRDWTG